MIPALRSALTDRVVVEQAKGFVRERLDVSLNEAFVSRSLVVAGEARQDILGGLAALHEGYGL